MTCRLGHALHLGPHILRGLSRYRVERQLLDACVFIQDEIFQDPFRRLIVQVGGCRGSRCPDPGVSVRRGERDNRLGMTAVDETGQSCAAIRVGALSAQPAETGMPSSMPMTCAARSVGTLPYAVSKAAAAFSTGP
jgi:hypothetical protein